MLKQFSSLRRRISFRAVLLLLAVLLTMPCSGCKKSADPVKSDPAEDVPVNLVYYTIGKPDEDLAAVNEELNKILAERYGFTVEYHKIGWNDYPKQITSIINTKQNYDIAFASTNLYVTNASNGNWMDLTSYLENDGRQLYETVNEKFWKGVTINERIYGVPTNKELASPLQLLFSKELVDKYGIDTSKYGPWNR